jgi:cold shock CspA family protein
MTAMQKKNAARSSYGARPSVSRSYVQVESGAVEVTTTVRRGTQTTKGTRQVTNGNMHGEIIFFLDDKGYGFVSRDDGGQDLFFHRSRLCDPDLIPKKRQRVAYKIATDERRRKMIAIDVRALD